MDAEISRIKAIFLEAVERYAPDQWDSYLQQACAGDAELERQVRVLLEAHRGEDRLFDGPATHPGEAVCVPALERPGTRIGPYRLIEKLGEGGMGVVLLAEQLEPVERQVALKIIRPGMDTDRVIARFEAERQALAVMDHPHVAKVLDAGTTETGRPFFVMELVRGLPITQFCDQHALSIRERLELFIPVCRAVQHAHQKGIIHRDLKPSNIMVADCDGRAMPKVIDFGVAKAIDQEAMQKRLATECGQIVGTLEYMSPEQARLSQRDVDTRSDVYALGAVLYELLTGITPFDKERLYAAAFDQALRMIDQEEPPAPSSRLSRSDSLPSVAAQRGIEPARLPGLIRGELDWIVMKALEKDRGRRYDSAAGLAADIDNYLRDQPVLAGPPSAAYRFRKFAQRHQRVLWAAGLAVLALLVGLVGSVYQAVRATRAEELAETRLAEVERERDSAERARADAEAERDAAGRARREAEAEGEKALAAAAAERTALDQAQKRLDQLQLANQILGDIFADLDIHAIRDGPEPLEAVLGGRLVRAAEQLEAESVGDPLVVAELQHQLARSLLSLGHAKPAIELSKRSYETHAELLGAEHPDTLSSLNYLGRSYQADGQYDRALTAFEETLNLRTAVLGRDHSDTLNTLNNLATGYLNVRRDDQALALFEEALERSTRVLGPDHADTLTSANNLATCYLYMGQYEKALALLTQTLNQRMAMPGPDHPGTLLTMSNLAAAHLQLDQLDEALELLKATLKRQTVTLGPDHPNTLVSMHNLAALYLRLDQLDEALAMSEETLRRLTATLGADHPDTLDTMREVALTYSRMNRLDEALAMFEETLKRRRAALGPDHMMTVASKDDLAGGYEDAGRYDQAVPLREEALNNQVATRGPHHPDSLRAVGNLAVALHNAGRPEQALPLLDEATSRLKSVLGVDHPDTLDSVNDLAVVFHTIGRTDKAASLLDESLPLMQATLGPDHPLTLTCRNNLAAFFREAGRHGEALTLREETLELTKAKLGRDHPQTLKRMAQLASDYRDAGLYDRALPLMEDALTRVEATLGPDHPDTLTCRNNLAVFYREAGKHDEALSLHEEAVRRLKTSLGSDHRNTLMGMYNLALTYEDAGQLDEAQSLLEETVAGRKAILGRDHPDTLASMNSLATCQLSTGQVVEAERLAREILRVSVQLRPDHWSTFDAHCLLGSALASQQRFGEAEPLLLDGYQGLIASEAVMSHPERRMIAHALRAIVRLYDDWDKPDQAEHWRQQRAQWLDTAAGEPHRRAASDEPN